MADENNTSAVEESDLEPVEEESDDDLNELLNMDLNQLSNAAVVVAPALETVVSSVARHESTIGRSPAAVFVVTQEMIQRSGARNIPDILRMVPGVQVARINANSWAVTSRGFNGLFANKLLVQIDGRSVYNQTYSGVFWDMQDLVLEDIERIEVIRGPGASVWGANAMNGVINIITKQAKDTQGFLVVGGTGTEERGFSTVRYGGKIGTDLHWRAYGKQFERDGGYESAVDFDDWRQGRGGFRTDWTPSKQDTFTFQGDFFEGDSGSLQPTLSTTPPYTSTLIGDNSVRGQNYLARWTHVIDEDSDWSLQSYYDDWQNHQPFAENQQQTFDIDFQHRLPLGQRHSFTWGLGYRNIDASIRFQNTLDGSFSPEELDTNLYSGFVQDEIELLEDRWYLVGGAKFEHNDFTQFEYQPTVRLLHLPSNRASAWLSVSRAVRTPSRIENQMTYNFLLSPTDPTFGRFLGSESVLADELLAYELGYRAQPRKTYSWEITMFYHQYRNLIYFAPSGTPFFDADLGGIVVPYTASNPTSADSYGAELNTTLQVNPSWELYGAFTYLLLDIHGVETPGFDGEGQSPRNQVYCRSSWNLNRDWEADLFARYVDALPAISVPSYFTMDFRLAWTPFENFEWALVGRNLLDSPRPELTDTFYTVATEVQAEMFTMMTWTY